MHKRLVALPGRQAAEHRRGGGREMVSISWVEARGLKRGLDKTHGRLRYGFAFALTPHGIAVILPPTTHRAYRSHAQDAAASITGGS